MNSLRSYVTCRFLIALAATMLVCLQSLADTITLKSAARQRDGTSVITLQDIAVLEGAEALRLADVHIAAITQDNARSGRPVEIAVADVRRMLTAAGANWARLHLHGRSVIVRPARSSNTSAPAAMEPAQIDTSGVSRPGTHAEQSDASSITLDAIVNEQTILGSISRLLLTQLQARPNEVRIRPIGDIDTTLMLSLDTGHIEIQPLGSLAGDRVAFEIRQWNGDAIQQRVQVAMTVERLVSAARATHRIGRGSELRDSDIESAHIWMMPTQASQAAPPAAIVGRVADRSISAGEIIRIRDVQRETVMTRGDIAIVRCIVGGVAIALQAEARSEGSVGDVIEFRKSGERESFLATITGRGEAVVDLGRR